LTRVGLWLMPWLPVAVIGILFWDHYDPALRIPRCFPTTPEPPAQGRLRLFHVVLIFGFRSRCHSSFNLWYKALDQAATRFDLTRRCSQPLAAYSLTSAYLKHGHFNPVLPPSAVADLVLVG
jgi:hypothetical protein